MKLRSLLILLLLSTAAFGQTNVPISQLPAASTLTGSELLWISQGGHSVRTTTQGVANLAGASTAGFGIVISGGMIRIDTTKAATQNWVTGQIAAIPNPLWSNIQSKPSSFPPSSHTHVLADLTQGGATTGQVPQWNGTAWVPATIAGGGGGGTVTSFSFTNSIGVTGNVSNANTTPALSLSLTSAAVGLGNVNNTSDANKPVSSATQAALDLKANLASPTFTGTVSGITAAMVGLGNVDNTSDANKPISSATATALAVKSTIVPGINTVTTDYTLQASDNGGIVIFNSGSAVNCTVPTGLGVGFNCTIIQVGAGVVTFVASGTTIVNGHSYTKTAGQNLAASIIAKASNSFITFGEMQ